VSARAGHVRLQADAGLARDEGVVMSKFSIRYKLKSFHLKRISKK
jgi:hypothetical protein